MLACTVGIALPAGATGGVDDTATGLERTSLEQVAILGPADVRQLEQMGLDVTHDVTESTATVALYSDAERTQLDRAGFESQTLIADLAAKNRADRAGEAEAAAAGPSLLPSGRQTYRVYEDYVTELNQLAEENPEFVRKVKIGESIEGRDIIGVEIASEVDRTDDGRPVFLQAGLHHAREWPSGEFPMEFALDLVNGFNADDPRITEIVNKARTVIVPVVNPDGFSVSRGAAISPVGGAGVLGIGGGSGEYRRKNCRPADAAQAALPCAQRPTTSGIDLNRNYGYYWGGPGASASPGNDTYRGAAPFSEPETQAVHEFSSRMHPTVVISNHTFTENGWWLRQPGFNGSFFPQQPGGGAITPDEPAMKALGDAMGDGGTDNPLTGATGWPSDLGWELGDITGATEDWNYFAQGSYGYTPEARGPDFHGLYQLMVVAEYGGLPGVSPGGGVREAYLLAAEEAIDTDNHGVITGTAPPGATLTLHKEFDAPRHPSNGGAPTHEVLHSTMNARADGTYEWHVMPSDRPQIPNSPLPPGDEEWTMACKQPGQDPFTTAVEIARNQTVTVNWRAGGACGTEPVGNQAPTASFTHSPTAPETNQEVSVSSTSTDPEDGTTFDPNKVKWDFDNDGTYDETGLTATHTFTTAGSHPVKLEVTDSDGASDTETQMIVVSDPVANVPPTAGFDYDPEDPAVDEVVILSSTSTDSDGEIVSHDWDLDDDGAFDDAEGEEINVVFLDPGSYEITLQVIDDEGATGTITRTIEVTEAEIEPPADPGPGGGSGGGAGGPGAGSPLSGAASGTGVRARALRRCKRKRTAQKRRRCRRRAAKLPA